MKLPLFKSSDQPFSLHQTSWKAALDPVLTNPLNSASILSNVVLKAGSNTINTLLGEKLQGWSIVRQRSAASIYDEQDSNPYPALTLILVSSADCVVDLMVF